MRTGWIMLGLLLLTPVVTWSQQAAVSPEQQQRSLRFQLNSCQMELQRMRQSYSDELVGVIERAEKAEAAVTAAKQAQKPKEQTPAAVVPQEKKE